VYDDRLAQGAGAGSDQELLLRVEYVPGATWKPPGLLTGQAAAAALAGRRLDSLELERARSTLAVVNVGGRVAIDLFAAGRRVARLTVVDAEPGGQVASLYTERVHLGKTIVRLAWRNSNGIVSHDYAATARSLVPID
jgi:hypothetical protein